MKVIEKNKKTIKVLNYGCSANRAIAEGLMGTLQQNGYFISDSIKDADTIIINTCVVKQNTEHRMKSLLLSLSKTKELVITGCLPVVMQDWILQNLPHVKVLFPEKADQIIELLNKKQVPEIKMVNPSIWSQLYMDGRNRYNPIITIVEISRGCLGNCSYCIVKQAKGNLRSRSQESIVSEIKTAIHHGSREIWLTSQDTGIYGLDLSPKQNLPSLINSIVNIEGQFRVRLGMMTPFTLKKFFSPLIIQLNKEKVYSFLHLPIQSGSDSILRDMKRKETISYFLDLINQLKQKVPQLVIATDIIVGFPGETLIDFNDTISLLKQVTPTIVNISRYTDRPGTLAASMTNKISTDVKSDRSRELTKITRYIIRNELKKWIGWKGLVLINRCGKMPNQFIGRNSSYLPVLFKDQKLYLGQFLQAEIIEARSTYLIGKIKKNHI